jgi:hypothetical protein
MASGAEEGIGQTFALEGDRIYSAFSRLKDSQWSVVPGIPAGLVEGAAYRSVTLYGSGVLLSIILGAGAAPAMARRVTRRLGSFARQRRRWGAMNHCRHPRRRFPRYVTSPRR